MTILKYNLNWTDYLAMVSSALLVSAMHIGNFHIPAWTYVVPAILFGIDKFIRIGSAIFGGYDHFRRILFVFTLSVVIVFAIYNIATGDSIDRMRAYASMVLYLMLVALYHMVESFVLCRTRTINKPYILPRTRYVSDDDNSYIHMAYGSMPGEVSNLDGTIV